MSIEVTVSELIETIEARIQTQQDKHKDKLAEYEAKWAVYQQAWAKAVPEAVKKSNHKNGQHYNHYVGNKYVAGVWLPFSKGTDLLLRPSKPQEPNIKDMERDIAMLKRHAKPTICVSASSDLSVYL